MLNLDLSYVDITSPAFAQFQKWAEPAIIGNFPYGFLASDAIKLYLLTDNVKWATVAITLVEKSVVDAEIAIKSGAVPLAGKDSYYYAGEVIGNIATTYAFCSSMITSDQMARWEQYAEQTIFNIWNPSLAKWGTKAAVWSGWSTTNPGNNYFYSFLHATMYWALVKPVGGVDWLAFLRTKILPLVVAYFKAYGAGGGSREGTGYGISHTRLFGLYDLWKANTQEDLAAESSHVEDTIDYWIHATMPTFDKYAPIGDLARDSYPHLYDYHRALMLQARWTAAGTEQADRATWWLHSIPLHRMSQGFNSDYDLLPEGDNDLPPTLLQHHAVGVGHFFARSDWTPQATWMSFVAGKYDESHAHQDQGAFTLFREDFLAVTESIHSYRGLKQTPQHHNVVRFEKNGVVQLQAYAETTMTVVNSPEGVDLYADLTPFYAQQRWRASKGIAKWTRSLRFRGTTVEIYDDFLTVETLFGKVTSEAPKAIFQIQVPVEPVMEGSYIRAGKLLVKVISPVDPQISFLSWQTVDTDYTDGWRIDIAGGTTEYRVVLETTVIVDPEEDPEMIKELQAQVAALTLTVSQLQSEKTALEQKVASMADEISSLNTVIAEHHATITEQTATLELQAPMILELQDLIGAMKVINRYI